MREIKFRAIVADSRYNMENYYKKMIYSNSLIQMSGEDEEVYLKLNDEGWIEVDERTVGQYIGLKDKSGKEIYEGDIAIVTCYSYKQIESESTDEVVYSEALACFALSDGKNGFATLSNLQGPFRTEYEVIGNIYDNPDLLGV